MKRMISAQESKQLMLQILDIIDEICKENHLNYYLSGGTLIGAIRHKGFIPWDDDIDLVLFRDDFEKLRKILKEQTRYPQYTLLDLDSKGFMYPFLKLVDNRTVAKQGDTKVPHGIWVDIFPFDSVPDNAFVRYIYLKKCQLYRDIALSAVTDFNGVKIASLKGIAKVFLSIIGKFVGVKRIARMTEKHMQKYNGKCNANYVGCNYSPYVMREFLPKNVVLPVAEVIFENRTYFSFKNWDIYLKRLFNDYMKMPPKEKQKAHNVVAWWLD